MNRGAMHEAIGEARGQKTLLQRMLENIFGPLPAEAKQRIDEATPEQLKSWALSVRDAGSVDDVLNGAGR